MSVGHRAIPGAERLAVLRATALGDFVFALPALDSLRAAYPSAEITLLGRAWHADFLAGRPGPVDRVVALPPGLPDDHGGARPLDAPAALAALAAERFDVAIQLHGGGRNSNPIVLDLGARVSVGCRTPDAPALDRNLPYAYYQHEVLRCLEVVSLVGAAPVTLEPRLVVTDADRASLDAALPALARAARPVAVLHPGATDPRRRWPPASFALVGDRLAAAGALVVVTGGVAERGLTASVVEAMDADALDLGGRLDLPALVALLERAAVVLSNDTGPLHLAAAVGTATVGIFWCGNVINAGPPFRKRHRPAISWRVHCPDCGADCTRDACSHRASFVADVGSAEVTAAALELLVAELDEGPPSAARTGGVDAAGRR